MFEPTIKFNDFEITGHIHSPRFENIQCSILATFWQPNEDEFGMNSGWETEYYYHICLTGSVAIEDVLAYLAERTNEGSIVYQDPEYTIIREFYNSVYHGIDY